MPRVQTNADIGLMTRIRALEAAVRELRKATPLRSASITEGGLIVGGNGWVHSDNWDGTSQADPGDVGWALGGPLGTAIINTLLLRNGIIGNDALTTPVGYGSASGGGFGFTVTTSPANFASAAIPVQQGFNSAIVLSFASILALNPPAGNDYLSVWARIAAVDGDYIPYPADSPQWCAGSMMGLQVLSGLSTSSSIAVTCRATSQEHTWTADPSNRAYVRALALFFRA